MSSPTVASSFRGLLLLLLCVTSVLTSTINNKTETSESSVSPVPVTDNGNKSREHDDTEGSKSSAPQPIVNGTTLSINGTTTLEPFIGEGGPINVPSYQPIRHTQSNTTDAVGSFEMAAKSVPQKENSSLAIHSKIVARKGTEGTSSFTKLKPLISVSDEQSTDTSVMKTVDTDVQVNEPLKNTISSIQPKSEEKLHKNSTVRTFKPKPTRTSVEIPNEHMPISPTKTSHSSGSRKMSYIVPIVIIIVPLPLLAVTAFIMYKRGRDCWEKRHYRRMDFLIDGMYND